MLTDDEKQHIIEKVQFEQEVKASVAPPAAEADGKGQWRQLWDAANSGVALLIAGAVVTAGIVPTLQSHQQEVEWKRQIRADSAKFKLGMMRDCLQEFMAVNSFGAQTVELSKQIDNPDRLSAVDYKDIRARINKLIANSTERSAKALGMTVAFPDSAETRKSILEYDRQLQQYLDTVDRLLETKFAVSQKQAPETSRQLKIRLGSLSGFAKKPPFGPAFEACIGKITRQIADQEAKYEKSSFNDTQ